MTILTSEDAGFQNAWNRLWEADPDQRPIYGPHNLAYYRAYAETHRFDDRSFVVLEGDIPVIGVRIALQHYPSGDKELSCFGLPILALQSKAGRPARRILRQRIEALIAEGAPNCIRHQEYLHNGNVSEFGRILLDLGAQAEPVFMQMIDLGRPLDSLHADLTKSCRWGVNWGRKNLTLRVDKGAAYSPADIEPFRVLHTEAAGRETRPAESWAAQSRMVREGEAFVVNGLLDGELVTAGLFSVSTRGCFYGVGASKRSLMDKPLSHVILWTAIEHAKTIGCARFETGLQIFDAKDDEKLLAISRFKRSFGGETRVGLAMTLNLRT